MKNLKSKLIIFAIVVAIGVIALQSSVYATNENIEILGKSSGEYLIYIKDNLTKDFQFAFSNDVNADKTTLTYKTAETDSVDSNANKVAYINSTTIGMFSNPTYIWAKDLEGNYFLNGIQIDLSKSMHEYDLQFATNITKTIPVDTTKTNTEKETINGKEITVTKGKVVLSNSQNQYSYLLVRLPKSDEYIQLMNLATRISKFNNSTDMHTKIKVYNEFFKLFNNLIPSSSDTEWVNLSGNEILQPKDAEDGEQYILWIKEATPGEIKLDVQFLTSHKEYSEEKIIEKITTKLPVTYDNNTLLIALAVLVILTLTVFVAIKKLEKKQKK